jgi:hypothetical protein
MARLHFRTTAFELDDNEHIEWVTAFADDLTLIGVKSVLGDVEVLGDAPGGKKIRLTQHQAFALLAAAGQVAPIAAEMYRSFGDGDVYESLQGVRYWEEGFDD